MQQGADPTETDCRYVLPKATLLVDLLTRKLSDDSPLEFALCVVGVSVGKPDFFYALTAEYLLDELSNNPFRLLAHSNKSSPQATAHIINMISPPWATSEFGTRLEAAYYACTPRQHSDAFWLCLSQSRLDSSCLVRRLRNADVNCRNESLVCCLGRLMCRFWTRGSGSSYQDYTGWRSLLHATVRLGGLQASFEHDCQSPMLGCLFPGQSFDRDEYYTNSIASLSSHRMTHSLRQWAREIHLAGQDLELYGQLENRYLDRWGRLHGAYSHALLPNLWSGHVKFVYGKSPDDWQIWMVTTLADAYSSESWDGVQNDIQQDIEPSLPLPGAWPDTRADSESSDYERPRCWELSKRRRRRYLRYMGLPKDQSDEIFPYWKAMGEDHVKDQKQSKALRDQFFKDQGITPPHVLDREHAIRQRAPR